MTSLAIPVRAPVLPATPVKRAVLLPTPQEFCLRVLQLLCASRTGRVPVELALPLLSEPVAERVYHEGLPVGFQALSMEVRVQEPIGRAYECVGLLHQGSRSRAVAMRVEPAIKLPTRLRSMPGDRYVPIRRKDDDRIPKALIVTELDLL